MYKVTVKSDVVIEATLDELYGRTADQVKELITKNLPDTIRESILESTGGTNVTATITSVDIE